MIDIRDFLKGKIKQDIKTLYLQFIYILEDYKAEGKLTEAEFQRARKRILDYGNNTSRSLESQLEELDVKLKQKE